VSFVLAGLLTFFAAAGWLDAAPAPWNAAGAPIPAATNPNPGTLPRCADQERPAATPEETQVAAAGWKLERYWATDRAGDLVLVTATAGYDGMCRPWEFQGFAFAGGRLVGTLAPQPMRSREDGTLVGTPKLSPDGLSAQFTRYKPTDPLCCPSGGRTTVEYAVRGGVLVPTRIAQAPAVPAQLPRTGGVPLPLGVLAGWLLGLSGLYVYSSARLRHS